ncbi:MAG: hypothetical protein FWG50_14095 [Kiritimatiellaeota bacterium]|nr:hypothetical protein [Kiritimatiellota bacterium]
MKMKMVLAGLFMSAGTAFAAPIQEATFPEISRYYDGIVDALLSPGNPFPGSYKPLAFDICWSQRALSQQQIQERGLRKLPFHYYQSVTFVCAQFDFQVADTDPPKLIQLSNCLLSRYLRTNSISYTPVLSTNQVVAQAEKYCDVIGCPVPPAMSVREVSFQGEERNCWVVRWAPSVNGFAFDEFSQSYAQHVTVHFHERYGFVWYSSLSDWPPPKSTEVRITKEDAITKASKAVLLIQRTPYYRQCRLPGFVVSGVQSAELLVAAPNWLLDPKRAIWLRDKPPDETRLCWVITFTSVYTGKTEPNAIPLAPAFLVYIDAATGEIVGANFT